MKVILIAGTWAGNPTWIENSSGPFQQALAKEGFETARVDGVPFRWSTKLGGIPFFHRNVWNEATEQLRAFAQHFAYDDLNFIAHSHGGQLAIKLAASGFPMRTLTTIATPRRHDIPAEAAVKNIGLWQHVFDNNEDHMASMHHVKRSLGALFDGSLDRERRFLIPGVINVGFDGIGHSEILEGRVRFLQDALVFASIRDFDKDRE